MAFLIFAYRKLFLKRKINDKNYRLMVLSQRQQNITDQIGIFQRLSAGQKNMTNMMAQMSTAGMMCQSYYKTNEEGQAINKDGLTQEQFQTANPNVQFQPELNPDYAAAQQKLMNAQYAAAMAAQATNSIFEAQNQALLAPLNMVDSDISIEMANLESQLKLLQAELESVEKAESESAKQCAPKFGLG